MATLAALLVFVLIPPAIWWLYGPQQLAMAAKSGVRYLMVVMLGAVGGMVAGMVSIASGASGSSLVAICLIATALASLPVAHGLRARRGEALGAEPAAVAKTEIDYVWVPPLPSHFKCTRCGWTTDQADRPWSTLRRTGACPKCGTPAKFKDA